MYSKTLRAAAKLLDGPRGDAGLLNYRLAQVLRRAVLRCEHYGIELSVQAIIAIIAAWELQNPNSKIYGE